MNFKFPSDFLFGCASSAYQIESGCNEGGKGENVGEQMTAVDFGLCVLSPRTGVVRYKPLPKGVERLAIGVGRVVDLLGTTAQLVDLQGKVVLLV